MFGLFVLTFLIGEKIECMHTFRPSPRSRIKITQCYFLFTLFILPSPSVPLFALHLNAYGKHINDHKVELASSLANKYVFHPIDIEGHFLIGGALRCSCDGPARGGEIGIGKVYVLEGVIALHEEVHVDVGVVVQGLVALDA